MELLDEELYNYIKFECPADADELMSEIRECDCKDLIFSTYQNVISPQNKNDDVKIKTQNYIKFYTHTTMLIVIQIVLYAMYFYLNLDNNYLFAFAKGFGMNIRIITILLFFSMMRTTLGNLSFIYPKVNEHTLTTHSFLGKCLGFHSFGHTICHIINGISFNLTVITGFVLLFVMILIVGSAIFRKINYKLFEYTHMLYIIWLPLCIIHTLIIPDMYIYFTVIGSFFALERIYDLLFKTTWYSFVNSKICDKKTTYICCPREHTTYPGSYYRIKVPSLSFFWHPFSLSGSVTSKYLKFFVESTGDWTKGLYNLVKNNDNKNMTIAIQGPFISSSRHVFDNPKSRNLLIATGIGITPFFSILSTKISYDTNLGFDKELFNELFDDRFQSRLHGSNLLEFIMSGVGEPEGSDELIPLYCVWSIRNPKYLSFYLRYLDLLIKYSPKTVIFLDVYITKKTTLIKQIKLILSIKRDYLSLNVYFRRPNIEKIVDQYKPGNIYYCGSSQLKDVILDEIDGRKINFFCESFD